MTQVTTTIGVFERRRTYARAMAGSPTRPVRIILARRPGSGIANPADGTSRYRSKPRPGLLCNLWGGASTLFTAKSVKSGVFAGSAKPCTPVQSGRGLHTSLTLRQQPERTEGVREVPPRRLTLWSADDLDRCGAGRARLSHRTRTFRAERGRTDSWCVDSRAPRPSSKWFEHNLLGALP